MRRSLSRAIAKIIFDITELAPVRVLGTLTSAAYPGIGRFA
jgi:hypothetical protein